MTHDEAASLLPAYALGAVEDPRELEEHLRACDRCTALLADYLETTAALGAAAPRAQPPASLRAAVLARLPESGGERAAGVSVFRRRAASLRRYPFAAIAALAIVVFAIGFIGGTLAERRQTGAAESALAADQRGLDLMTSTETLENRLVPVVPSLVPLGDNTHGHWFHRPGVATQILVIESMPPPPPGDSYYGWLQRKDGSWRPAGPFTLDSTGYGRIILFGGDGSDVQGVQVTRQSGASQAPTGDVVLRTAGP